MSTLDKIRNHQRILVTGHRSTNILAVCTKVLDFYHKPYDLISPEKEKLNGEPIVLIQAGDDFGVYQPHIALVDEVDAVAKASYEKLADSIPKAGTLVYNTSNSLAKSICSTPRADVYREEYKDSTVNAAAMALLRRLGINEKHFVEAL